MEVPYLYKRVQEFLLERSEFYPPNEFRRVVGMVYKVKRHQASTLLKDLEKYGLVEVNPKNKNIRVLKQENPLRA